MSICSMLSSWRRPGRHRLRERIEVGDHQLERLDPEVRELLRVLGTAYVGEQAGVHPRVQRLDPAVEALRESGEVSDLGHRDAGLGDARGRAAGGDKGDTGRVEAAGELDEPGLVVDADQRAAYRSTPLIGVAGGFSLVLKGS